MTKQVKKIIPSIQFGICALKNTYTLVILFMCISIPYGCKENHVHNESPAFPTTWDSLIYAPGVISTMLNERDLNISADGKELFFTRGTSDNKRRCLMSSKWIGDQWSSPDILPFSGVYQDIEPFLSPDASKLFFASNRPLGGETNAGDYNIWYVVRNGETWGDPQSVGALINSQVDEFFPSVGHSGNLYFTAEYPDGIGLEDIYVSYIWEGQYQKPVLLDTTINSKTYDFNAYIAPDESLIIYSSYGRKDDMGGGDLYMNVRTAAEAPWSNVQHLESPINSNSLDYCPFVDLKKEFLYFTSNRTALLPDTLKSAKSFAAYHESLLNGNGNIFKFPFKSLNQ